MTDISKADRPVNIGNPRMGWASDVAAEMLRRIGIKYVSMNPGASYRGFHDSIVNYLGNEAPQMLLCLHEDHAVHIAEGYAKATDEPMGCILHSNVGLMHGLMGIFNAWCYRAPMVVMGATGPVDSELRRPWIDWIHTSKDQGALLRNYTKWDDEPRSPQAIVETMLRANQITRSAPTAPVYVCLDAGLQETEIEGEIQIPDIARYAPSDPPRASAEAVAAAADMLLAAKSPLIMAGRMSRDTADWDRRVRLAELLGAGVVTDLYTAAAFPTDHGLHICPPAPRLRPEAKQAVFAADVLLSLNWRDLGGTFRVLKNENDIAGKVIHASLDSFLHNGWSMDYFELPAADIAVSADPDAFVAQLVGELETRLGGTPKWDGARKGPAEEEATPISARGVDEVIQPADIVSALGELRGEQDFCLNRVSSGGIGRGYHFRHPLDFLGHDGGGGLASGPGTSVGAALALMDTDRVVIAVLGDGDFMQGASALWTAAHYEIPVLIVISNNRSNFNDEMHQEAVAKVRDRPVENRWIGMRISDPPVDLCAIARGQGVSAAGPVARMGDLLPALAEGLEIVRGGKPHLIDVHVDTGYATAPLLRGAKE